eukprot:gnl/Trimastix_PCT/666.p1 GENE.gnl/Trimastix_PCT/666~~gnl/Trimastix_PCT/666.p1  ORF type:complete len:395 (+),score=93.42 gnl/Trimastix_PCT/666:41-1225(+)
MNHKTVPPLRSTTINPLASPKGVKYECEICGKVACLQCQQCRVTYYCCKEHQLIDWNGIHHKICRLLNKIRVSPTLMGSERERQKREQTREKMMLQVIELSKQEAMKFLVTGHYELAMAGALQAQRHSMEIFGANRVELVPSYLLLAEASMGLEHNRQAEGYLSKAKYNILKHPNCPNILQSRLHRACGRLYLVTGRKEQALQELANDIYFSSLDAGPEHIDTAPGYFHMANAFRICKRDEIASAFYEKFVAIWDQWLSNTLTAQATALEKAANHQRAKEAGEETASDDESVAQDPKDDEFELEETQVAETLDILTRITNHRHERFGDSHPLTGNAHRVLGMMFVYISDMEQAQQHLEQARVIYLKELGPDDPNTMRVEELLASIQPPPDAALG